MFTVCFHGFTFCNTISGFRIAEDFTFNHDLSVSSGPPLFRRRALTLLFFCVIMHVPRCMMSLFGVLQLFRFSVALQLLECPTRFSRASAFAIFKSSLGNPEVKKGKTSHRVHDGNGLHRKKSKEPRQSKGMLSPCFLFD